MIATIRIIALAATLALGACSRGTSDASLEANFKDHRAELGTLLRMAQDDQHMARIAPDFTWLTDDLSWPRENIGISAERWAEYRRLFKTTGVTAGISRPEDSKILFFIVNASGLVTGGDDKGYAFSSIPVAPVLISLDDASSELKSGQPGYKPLGDGWYVYYRWDD